jgi:dihydrofolate reductase
VLVVAVGPNGEIGRAGGIPWRLPEDLRHFKAATLGHAIVMGRKTFESIGRPLPGRRNIVVSRDRAFAPEGVETFASLDEALVAARRTDPEPRVIGGGEIYALALPLATELLVTHVSAEAAGDLAGSDAFFPTIDASVFDVIEERPFETPGVTLRHYRRRSRASGGSGSIGP